MQRKLLFFDIDGTLITDDKEKLFPESAKMAIREARKAGHLAFINSGRVLVNIEEHLRKEFDGLVCGCGTYIVAEGKELLHNELEQSRCYEIAKACRDFYMLAVFEHTNLTAFDNKLEGDGNRKVLNYFRSMGNRLIEDIDSEEFIFDKFAAWYEEGVSKVDEFKEFVKDDFTCIQREGTFLEVIPKGFSKATGIKFLQDYYNIDLQDVYVFGDSNNDLDMLKYAPNSIAMGVCTEEVEKVASFKTDTVENDGIYKAMKHFGVI